MEADNLIFSSKIDPDVEDICFDVLMDYFINDDYDRVYVSKVCLFPNEIVFFTEINSIQSIIRVSVKND